VPSLSEVLTARPYPGRGIVAARAGDGQWAICYFLTGRSDASQHRDLVPDDQGVLVVDTRLQSAHDELRHYRAVVRRERLLVVGNGDQAEPFADDIERGTDPWSAWKKHDYEPDPPIFTPRILLALSTSAGERTLHLAAVRNATGTQGEQGRSLQSWTPAETMKIRSGKLLTTYRGTTDDVIISDGPMSVSTESKTPADLETEIWEALSADVRVASITLTAEGIPVGTHHR
jgi:hypothetical protein